MWADVLPSHSVEVVEPGARVICKRMGCGRTHYLHSHQR